MRSASTRKSNSSASSSSARISRASKRVRTHELRRGACRSPHRLSGAHVAQAWARTVGLADDGGVDAAIEAEPLERHGGGVHGAHV
eukprot:4280330-Ditylum_brightwellii.AAC.1